MKFNVAVLLGSLRKESYSRSLAIGLADLSPAELNLNIVEIGELPFYNEDFESDMLSSSWKAFRDKIAGHDAMLFITPEYNRSVPAVLKNALDVGSRPYGKGVWSGKPGGIITISPGQVGGFGANHHLRQTLTFLNIPAMQQPEAYLSNISTIVKDGKIIKDDTAAFLKNYLSRFHRWIERCSGE